MKKITTLTAEQERQIPQYVQKWIDNAETPINKEVVKTLLESIMPDRTVVFTESLQNTIDVIRENKEKLSKDNELVWSFYCSYFWYSWAGLYDFSQSIGVEFDEKILNQFFELILNAPIIVFVNDTIFVVEKPTIRWDEQGRLSSDQKQAIEWSDGTGLYYLDGVSLTDNEWKTFTSGTMKLSAILKISDADKRVLALKYNSNAFLKEATLLDEHERYGELFKLQGHEVNTVLSAPELYFLRMKCPSTKRIFIEAVEPEYAKQYPYALHCQAHNSGVPVEIYDMIQNHG